MKAGSASTLVIQRSENPGGGKLTNEAEVKATTTTTTSGVRMNSPATTR